jgi:hypothetical protein
MIVQNKIGMESFIGDMARSFSLMSRTAMSGATKKAWHGSRPQRSLGLGNVAAWLVLTALSYTFTRKPSRIETASGAN